MTLAIPGIVLSFGLLTSALPRPGMALILLLVFVPLHSVGIHSYFKTDYDRMGEIYPALASLVAEQAQPGDGIALFWSEMQVPYEYYLERIRTPFPIPRLLYPPRDAHARFQTIFEHAERPRLAFHGIQRVWLVLHAAPATTDNSMNFELTQAIEREFRLTQTYRFPYWTVFLYSRPWAEAASP